MLFSAVISSCCRSSEESMTCNVWMSVGKTNEQSIYCLRGEGPLDLGSSSKHRALIVKV